MTERGWLIADGGDPPHYRHWDGAGPHWTLDPFQAIRLARRADAEALAAGDEDAWCIVEYEFGRSRAQPLTRGTKVVDLAKLSPREAQVLTLTAAGHSVKIIARKLSISPKTVEMNRMHVKQKMAIQNTVEWYSFLRELTS